MDVSSVGCHFTCEKGEGMQVLITNRLNRATPGGVQRPFKPAAPNLKASSLVNLQPHTSHRAVKTARPPVQALLPGSSGLLQTLSSRLAAWQREDQLAQEVKQWVQVPPGTRPSPAFISQVQTSLAQALSTLPPELVDILRARKFQVHVYKNPNDYVDRYQTFEDFTDPHESYRSFIREKDRAPTMMYPEAQAQLEDSIKKTIMYYTRAAIRQSIALHIAGEPYIIVHENLSPKGGITAGILRHEIGHYVDYLPRKAHPRLSDRPDYEQALIQDLENLAKNPVSPVEKTGEKTFNLHLLARLGMGLRHLLQPVLPPEQFLYYFPADPTDTARRREAFAEIFASNFGGGAHPAPAFIRAHIYPRTSRLLREQFLPSLYQQTAEQSN